MPVCFFVVHFRVMHHVHSISLFYCLILSCYFGQDHMAEFFCEGFNEKGVNIYSDHMVKELEVISLIDMFYSFVLQQYRSFLTLCLEMCLG